MQYNRQYILVSIGAAVGATGVASAYQPWNFFFSDSLRSQAYEKVTPASILSYWLRGVILHQYSDAAVGVTWGASAYQPWNFFFSDSLRSQAYEKITPASILSCWLRGVILRLCFGAAVGATGVLRLINRGTFSSATRFARKLKKK